MNRTSKALELRLDILSSCYVGVARARVSPVSLNLGPSELAPLDVLVNCALQSIRISKKAEESVAGFIQRK